MSARTLVLIRHAKSDWDVPVPDRQRPLNARGARQAPATGKWLSDNGIQPDLALVSPAARARRTWQLVAEELPGEPPVEVSETELVVQNCAVDGTVLDSWTKGLEKR